MDFQNIRRADLSRIVEKEAVVIGNICLGSIASIPFSEISAVLKPNDFSNPDYRHIFTEAVKLHNSGISFDCVALAERVKPELQYLVYQSAKDATGVRALEHAKELKLFALASIILNPANNSVAEVEKAIQEKSALDSLSSNELRSIGMPDFLNLEIPAQEDVVSPIIKTSSISLIHAPAGIGKSHFVTEIGFAVATGKRAFKWDVPKARNVLLVDGEMPRVSLIQRYRELLERNRITPNQAKGFNVLSFEDFEDFENGLDLSTKMGQSFVESELEKTKAELLILDNMDSLFSGDENRQADLQSGKRWLKEIRGKGIAVIVIHHANKGGGYSGHNAIARNPDLIIGLKRPDDYDAEEGARFSVNFEKARGIYGVATESFELHLKDNAWQIGVSAKSPKGVLLSIVEALIERGVPMSMAEIAEEIGADKNSVSVTIKRAFKNPSPVRIGAESWAITRLGGGMYTVERESFVPCVPCVPSVPSVPFVPCQDDEVVQGRVQGTNCQEAVPCQENEVSHCINGDISDVDDARVQKVHGVQAYFQAHINGQPAGEVRDSLELARDDAAFKAGYKAGWREMVRAGGSKRHGVEIREVLP